MREDTSTAVDLLTESLRAKGMRMTPQRAVIYEIMKRIKGHGHLTAQEVFERARDRLPGLNVATVYRTLEMLHEAELVDLMAYGTEVRFSLRDPKHRHCHLVCRNCDRVLDLELDEIERLAKRLKTETGFAMDVDHLTLSGLCKRCGQV
jgi:Fur family ferric uptake transcriptional regulator